MNGFVVHTAAPRGFCAGVDRAIEIVERTLALFGAPVYVRHEVVHNRYVVNRLRDLGARFVEELDEVPDGATVIFSAHGVASAVEQEAARRGLQVFDATCPLVTKVHLEVLRHARAGFDCLLIGHAGHPEVVGTLGRFEPGHGGTIQLVESSEHAEQIEVAQPERLAWVSQTTLSVDDTRRIVAVLERRFPAIQGPRKGDICYAAQNRQDAVKALAAQCDVVLVVGSPNSSNSNRLREVAEQYGARAWLIDSADELQAAWLDGADHIGVTAGASAPERLVEAVIERLKGLGGQLGTALGSGEETVQFALPAALRADQ